jgi:hypothetical protein
MRSLDFCSTPGAAAWSSRAVLALNQAKVEKIYFSSRERAWLVLTTKKEVFSLLSLFPGLKSNQKRLLNFYKELAIASLRCARHR